MRNLTLIITIALLSIDLTSQEDRKFCQFIMTNVENRAKTLEIDAFVRKQEGVFISRADLNSKKYLLIYNNNSSIDIDLIKKWMMELKVELKCIREGIYGIDKILDQKPDCE